jgi:hypothetical protein
MALPDGWLPVDQAEELPEPNTSSRIIHQMYCEFSRAG